MPGERERLSASDASNLVMDSPDQVNVPLVVGVLGVGGFVSAAGEADLDLLRADLAARLRDSSSSGLVRFTQRVQDEGRSLVWEDCRPDLTWHVRQAAPVDGLDGLAGMAATLMTHPLPLDRPLWELLIVPGAGTDGPGIILRAHHCVADGVAGVRLLQDLFGDDASPNTAPGAPAAAPAPTVEPPQPRRPRWKAVATGVTRVSSIFRATVPPTVLLGPIGPQRGVAFADVEFGALSRAAKGVGATVNDALLAAVTVAAEAALRADGHPVPPMLPASVPVALPGRGDSGNAVGVMLVPLAMGVPGSVPRLTRIAALTRAAKAEARAQGTFELTRTRWGSRLFAWLARRQRFIALFVTNVRGPDRLLTVAGAPVERMWPVAVIQGNVRFGVAAMSYAGRLGVAVHADAEALPVPVAGRALGDELTRIASGEVRPRGRES
ncbi:wax ester/triacylglycerol synthase domain-containing protein [Tessaracoccus sp. Y1736]